MDKGVSYTFSVAAYPRVKYFQDRLKRLIPRWQRILNAGKLPECISQGKVKLEEILSLTNEIQDRVTVNLFADVSFIKIGKLDLYVQTKSSIIGHIETSNLTWRIFTQGTSLTQGSSFTQGTSFTQEKEGKTFIPTVTVIVLQSLDEQVLKTLEADMSHLSKAQQRDTIIYFEKTETNYTYTDLVRVNFQQEDIDVLENLAFDRSRSLNKQIQHLLEEKVIAVLDTIAAYNKVFIPKKEEEVEETLQDAVHLKLLRSLRNPFVVKDLSPDNRNGETEKKPMDKELMRLAKAVENRWEILGPSLGITETKINEIKQTHQSMQSKIYDMLLVWQKGDKARLDYLLQLLKNASAVVTVDLGVIKAMKEELSVAERDSGRDKVFHRKLLDFVAKKTKCVACDKLSQKYGISPSLINEFLNEGFFDYEKKVAEMMESMSLPSWPRDKSDNGVSTCRTFAHRCGSSMPKITHDAEDYIKTRREILISLKKLQFELFGFLQQTDVAIETKIPDIPKLTLELQHSLLGIPEVYGCGTVWGDLELHVTKDLSPADKNMVKEILLEHKYTYGYTTKLIEPLQVQVGGSIEQGARIRAKKQVPDSDGEYIYGSLGCFVNVIQRGTNGETDSDNKLHCITCAHCVLRCRNLIEVYYRGTYRPLGVKAYEIFEHEAIDVATIEINRDQVKHCDKTVKSKEDSLFPHTWTFYDKAAVRKTIYKYGSVTGLTHGICVSDDYETKEMIGRWNDRNGTNFDINRTILIEVEADQAPGARVEGTEAAGDNQQMQIDEEKVFSKEGDSGSVICDDDIDTGDVVVMALLCGDIRTTDKKFLYSYSSHIQKVVERLQDKYNCIIEPAT